MEDKKKEVKVTNTLFLLTLYKLVILTSPPKLRTNILKLMKSSFWAIKIVNEVAFYLKKSNNKVQNFLRKSF